jgi:hypothetical protein
VIHGNLREETAHEGISGSVGVFNLGLVKFRDLKAALDDFAQMNATYNERFMPTCYHYLRWLVPLSLVIPLM